MNITQENNTFKGHINTSWDDYYLNPYRYNLPSELDEEIITVSSPNSISLVDLINNLTNKALNKDKDKDKNLNINNKTKLSTNYVLTNNFEQNEQKFNPILFKLIANDNTVQLENLLKNKIHLLNIDEQDKDGDTPLHISVFLSNTNAIKILIDYGADIYILDKWGQTSLHRICFSMEEEKSLDILNIFIKQNNKNNKKNNNNNIFNIQDNYGNTPCHLVLKHIIKNKTILNKNYKLLIKKIISKTSKKLSNTDGYTVDNLLKNINLY
jgi:ankyrin repeat protein